MTSTSLDLSQIKTDAIASAASFRALVGVGERNEADGFVGVEEDGTVSAIVTVRRGTAAELNAIVLAAGELAIVTDATYGPSLRSGNGVTSGGVNIGSAKGRPTSSTSQFYEIDFADDGNMKIGMTGLAWTEPVEASTFEVRLPSGWGFDTIFAFPNIPLFHADFSPVVIAGVTTKTSSGDKTTNITGEIVINTNSKTIKMYADGGWRTLASW